MADLIVIGTLLVIAAGAITVIAWEKKRGSKCIGCLYGGGNRKACSDLRCRTK